MYIKAIAPVASLFFAVVCVAATEVSEEALHKIATMEYRGIGFTSSPTDLKEAIPKAVLNTFHPGDKEGIKTYEVRDDADHDCVLLRFVDGVLIEIDFIYFPKRVAAKGGLGALNALALKTYGDATTRTDQTLLWDFPAINRMIVAFCVDGKWSLHVYDRARRLAKRDYVDTTVSDSPSQILITVAPAVPYQPPAASAIPNSVVEPIQRNALQDHPVNQVTQDYVVGRQVRAYRAIENFGCPPGMQPRVFEYLVGRIKRDHPEDYSTQLYVLNRQVKAFKTLGEMSAPTDMASSHFFALREYAARRHPYDYSTQLYVLNRKIDKYMQYRTVRYDGDDILQYILKD